MKTKFFQIVFVLGFIAITGIFVWGALRTPALDASSDNPDRATASISEALSEGRLDVQVYATGNRNVRLEIRFMPDADAAAFADMRPDVNFAMIDEHNDGFDPPLEMVEAGRWRARFKLPMAGRWVANVGFGEDFAEVEFDAR